MARTDDKFNRRRLKTSYVTTVVSISLVLFMLGLLGVLLLHAKKVSEYVRENIGFTIIMNDNVKDPKVLEYKTSLEKAPFIKESRYITREEAAQVLIKELGEDFIGFLGYNPLLPSIEVKLKSSYANSDSIPVIEKSIMANKDVKEVLYQKSLVNLVNENVRKISLIILCFSLLLLIISVALINNTIRLAVYSKRFLIKTMQLVGATENFIRKPFLLTGLVHGLYGAFFSLILLAGTMYLAQRQLPELINLHDFTLYLSLFGIVTVLGILISSVSTFLAVRKYLRVKAEYMY